MSSGTCIHTIVDIGDQNTRDPFLQQMIAFLLKLGINRQIQVIPRYRILCGFLGNDPAGSSVYRNLLASLGSPQIFLISAFQTWNTDLIVYRIYRLFTILLQLLQLLCRNGTCISQHMCKIFALFIDTWSILININTRQKFTVLLDRCHRIFVYIFGQNNILKFCISIDKHCVTDCKNINRRILIIRIGYLKFFDQIVIHFLWRRIFLLLCESFDAPLHRICICLITFQWASFYLILKLPLFILKIILYW